MSDTRNDAIQKVAKEMAGELTAALVTSAEHAAARRRPKLRHEPTGDCDGSPAMMPRRGGVTVTVQCADCRQDLCWCEYGWGHDCERGV